MANPILLAHIDSELKREQTLKEHSENVAAFCKARCAKIGLAHLGEFTALLHDCGKGSEEFQNYLRQESSASRGEIFHAYCGAQYCYKEPKIDLSTQGLSAQLAATAICSHHTGLPDVTSLDGKDNLYKKAFPEKNPPYEQALHAFLETCISKETLNTCFEKAIDETTALAEKILAIGQAFKKDDVQKTHCCFLLGMVQRYLLSALIDADGYDTGLFEEGSFPKETNSVPIWGELAQRLENHLTTLPCKTEIEQKRNEISEQCLHFAKHGQGIYRLSVPTGAGKTFSAMRYALNCAKECGKERVLYVAPYKSVLEQNAGDIRDALHLQGDDPSILLEHHSDIFIPPEEKEKQKLYQSLVQRWNAPLILTTTVQFLNTLFSGKNSSVRRMHALANSVIILDEVQAIPVKCTYILNCALNFLAYVCNCSIVLCTATQPSASTLDYPVLLSEPAQMTQNLEETFETFRRTEIIDKTDKEAFTTETLAEFCAQRLKNRENLLVVLNTKSQASALFQELNTNMAELFNGEKISLFYLSTNLCAQHRMDVIDKIKQALRSTNRRLICVSTQLIEAGVNLSFDCVIRAMAGLDSLAQAAGRCNRHGESTCREVYFVKLAKESLVNLEDILNAQKAAGQLLENYKDNSQQFSNSLLSPEAIRRYYRIYYSLQECRSLLPYPLGKNEDKSSSKLTNLLDLLSNNTPAVKACKERSKNPPQRIMHQAFETAGKNFKPIEEVGIDVIVPYGEVGKELIAEFQSAKGLQKLPDLLRKSQRYTVHIFEHQKKKLEQQGGAIYALTESGILGLKEPFYDDNQMGLQLSPHFQEAFLF